MDALIVSRAVERTVFMLCAPLLLYLGYRLLVLALDHNGRARAELRDKYKLEALAFLPGAACVLLALASGSAIFLQHLELSKAEQDLLIKLDEIHPLPQSAAPALPPGAPGLVAPERKDGPAPKPS